MATLEPKSGERVRDVRVTEDAVSVDLFDGRTITVPLAWFPRLLHATPEQRANWRVAVVTPDLGSALANILWG